MQKKKGLCEMTKMNSQVNFKSRLAPTEYLAKGFYTAIDKGFEGRKFLNSVKAVLNDGKNDVIKIDLAKDSKKSVGGILPYDIFVNDKKVVTEGLLAGSASDGEQCHNAIIEFAKNHKKIEKTAADSLADAQLLICKEVADDHIQVTTSWDIVDELNNVKSYFADAITKELNQIKNKIFHA